MAKTSTYERYREALQEILATETLDYALVIANEALRSRQKSKGERLCVDCGQPRTTVYRRCKSCQDKNADKRKAAKVARQNAIVSMRDNDKYSFAKIGQEFGISHSRAHQIYVNGVRWQKTSPHVC